MEDKREKIIEQIHKLMGITNPDSNAFQGEISNASAMIQRLMDKYSISEAEIAIKNNKTVEEAFDKKSSTTVFGGIVSWHWRLARVIQAVTHTKCYSTYGSGKTISGKGKSGKVIAFFGTPDNIAIATMLFDQWVGIITEMAGKATTQWCHELAKMYPEEYATLAKPSNYNFKYIPNGHKPLVFKSSWLKACVDAMNDAVLHEEKQRTTTMTNALVVYNKNVMVAYSAFSRGFRHAHTRGQSSTSAEGTRRGHEAGSKLHVSLHNLAD